MECYHQLYTPSQSSIAIILDASDDINLDFILNVCHSNQATCQDETYKGKNMFVPVV